ncbi:hypothetical protein P7K49_033687 [Saguinus oedipus]|uniref:DEAD/DEAH-box helicase domain-containing protein n=1 Tax=Saguinus oedipus TaxID=9490 RepID=A0ABQ9TTG2_SAGOE|nr:hypothetical protein P7K49_033687 [Saguinus oedipus]
MASNAQYLCEHDWASEEPGGSGRNPGNGEGNRRQNQELAYQIAEQFRVLGKPLGLKDCIIVGGLDMVAQALELSRKPHVVIATPGRLADHLRSSNTFSIKKIRFLVSPPLPPLTGRPRELGSEHPGPASESGGTISSV